MLGNSILLYVAGKPVASAQQNELDESADTIEVCSPTDGRAKRYITTTTGWQTSVNGLCETMDEYKRLRAFMNNGTPVEVHWMDAAGLTIALKGEALITNLRQGAPYNGLVTFSATLLGSGSLDDMEWKQVDMQAYDGYVADRCFLGDKDHHIAEQAGNRLLVKEIVVDTTVRMRLENESNGFCVLRLAETMQEVTGLLTQKDNLRLYQKEVAHADGMEHGRWDILLPKGKYYLIYDGGTENYITTSLLGLPTT